MLQRNGPRPVLRLFRCARQRARAGVRRHPQRARRGKAERDVAAVMQPVERRAQLVFAAAPDDPSLN